MGPSEALAQRGEAISVGATPVEIAEVTTSTDGAYVFWATVWGQADVASPARLECVITVDDVLAGVGNQFIPDGQDGSIAVTAWQSSTPANSSVVLECTAVAVAAPSVIDGRLLAMRVGSLTLPP